MIELAATADGKEVEISGTRDDMRALRECILEVSSGRQAMASVEAATPRDPRPYDVALAGMDVRLVGGGVVARVCRERLQVEGGAEELRGLASFFTFGRDAKPGDHAHYEYYEGNQWIRPDSVPLVIMMRRC
jgi:hypothetical protein